MKPDNIILEGVTGSTAYGLATENSDIDVKGVYLLPTEEVLSLRFNPQNTTKDHVDPDWVYHEVGKFMKLVASGNPTVTELLFLEEYTKLNEVGKLLVDNRQLFLSTFGVQAAYRGYALSQAKRLNNRTDQGLDGYDSSLKNRFAKHTRHCFRLLFQAKQLLETGELTVRVTPEQRGWLFEMGEQDVDTVVNMFILEDSKLGTIESVLPDHPDWDGLNKLLYQIRMLNG
jgi:predicted nucleotidyltransferase